MNDRAFTTEINEQDVELLTMLLERYEKQCLAHAEKCMSGYQSGTSQLKAQEWESKAEQARELIGKILENAN